MYKVLLVDDEEIALEYLESLIDWKKSGFDIIGCATTIEEAKELFEKEAPEIVISDICMPGQNGLDFCQYILSRNELTKIILLSAYREFEYARKAISMGVMDYVLKYELTENYLTQKLKNVSDVLEKEKHDRIQLQKQKVSRLIHNQYEESREDKEKADYPECSLIMVLLREDGGYKANEDGFRIINTGNKISDMQLSEISLLMDNSLKRVESLILNNNDAVLLYSAPRHIEKMVVLGEIEEGLTSIKEALRIRTGNRYSAGYAIGEYALRNIPVLYERINAAMEERFLKGTELSFLAENTVKKAERLVITGNAKEIAGLLGDHLQAMDFENAMDVIKKYFREYRKNTYPTEQVIKGCDLLLKIIAQWERQNFYMEEKIPEWMIFQNVFCVSDMEKEFVRIITQAQKHLNDKAISRYSIEVREAIRYMKHNYMEDISAQDVAENINLSVSYFSRIFKNETGKTVLEYLTRIRMDIARELLKERKYKIYEIGERVGYKTSQYFAIVFLRETGMSPGMYRKKASGKNEI